MSSFNICFNSRYTGSSQDSIDREWPKSSVITYFPSDRRLKSISSSLVNLKIGGSSDDRIFSPVSLMTCSWTLSIIITWPGWKLGISRPLVNLTRFRKYYLYIFFLNIKLTNIFKSKRKFVDICCGGGKFESNKPETIGHCTEPRTNVSQVVTTGH